MVGLSVAFIEGIPSSATSSQTLPPTGSPVGPMPGNALVVYDPGSTGAVKEVAKQIASDLAGQGFFVYLAGIDSETARGNASQYQVVVVGGPLDDGKASSSVQSYLQNLSQGNGTRIGVFGVGNSAVSNDQIAPLPSGSNLTIKETLEISTSQDNAAQSTEFVTKLLS